MVVGGGGWWWWVVVVGGGGWWWVVVVVVTMRGEQITKATRAERQRIVARGLLSTSAILRLSRFGWGGDTTTVADTQTDGMNKSEKLRMNLSGS